METATSSDFPAALAAVRGVEGWLTDAQARRLWDAAQGMRPGGSIVEIGSYRGRSTVVLARASEAPVVAIDPHAGTDRGPQEIAGYAGEAESDHQAFMHNLDRGGVRDRVRHVRRYSAEAHAEVHGEIDLLYVDGAHRYRPARDDIRDWGARVAPGGTLLIHDGFSSVGVTLATLRLLVPSRRFRYLGRTGSLIAYRREPAGQPGNALRQLAELPWFARNLLIKVAIVTRVRKGEWPH
jgi:predicted O-methyltransferase YrrM